MHAVYINIYISIYIKRCLESARCVKRRFRTLLQLGAVCDCVDRDRCQQMMEWRDKAAYIALRKSIPKFTQSALSPETLADELRRLGIVGNDTYHSALNENHDVSKRRRNLINAVMGSGRTRVFQDLVNILLAMEEYEWLGKELKSTSNYTLYKLTDL